MNALCPYFGQCGGCAYQDLSAADYHALKRRFIENALRHEGIDFPLDETIQIPAHTRRRATFAYHNHVLGFNAARSHQIIPIQNCIVLTPELEKLLPALHHFARVLDGSGDIAVLMTEWGIDITVMPQHIKQVHRPKKRALSPTQNLSFLETVNDFCQKNKVARFVYDDMLLFEITPLPFPPNVFMQPSVEGETALVSLVLKACSNSQKVLDLFCGLGTFTIPLQQEGKKVLGMDITEESIASLKRQNIAAEVRDLFRAPVQTSELNAYDTVVLDPARAGAKTQCEQLSKSDVKHVVMVSCNPLTFAKDCKVLLNGGYQLKWIVPVDQFIYTQHIEVVALLER